MEACTNTLWLGLQLASSGDNVQDHWSLFTLLHWTGWQQNSSVRTQNAVTDCTVYRCTVQFIIGVQVDTWSLLRCTGMRSRHYGFVCKHRQGLLCMFIYRRIGRIRIRVLQFLHRYCDDYTTSVPVVASSLSETIKTLSNGCLNNSVRAFSKYYVLITVSCQH